MAITTVRITDPYSGGITYTKTPKKYKGHWLHPFEYRRKLDENKEVSKKVQDKYKEFRRIVNLFRSA